MCVFATFLPQEKLMELNADAQKLFGLSYTYKPHLSLGKWMVMG